MSDTKADVLDMLRELSELTLLEEANPQSFRVRAYENAVQAISTHATDLGRLSVKDLQKIPGVGKSTADKIVELLETGRVEKVERLRQKYPERLRGLLRVQGLGPKAVLKLRGELAVESIEDLKRAVAAQKLRTLPGFGAKSEEKLAQALARLEQSGQLERRPISVALPHAERLVAMLREVPGVSYAAYCGSLRRFCETIGDIDIVVVSDAPTAVMDALVGSNVVDRVLVRGERKTSVVTRRGLQVDVRVVAAHQLGAALIYFTGSKSHNVKLRARAKERGFTLNEYALSELDSGRVIASETEEAVYAALGLPFIPPVLREDTGEIEAALEGRLPRPIADIGGDFHVHTSLSGDGRSTLEEMVAAARARGYAVLAITEHAEGVISGVSKEALLEQRAKLQALQAELSDLELLHGIELNIGPKGELDYDAEFRKSFDFCVASIHSHFELGRAAQTERLLSAMLEPSVRMIGHISGRMIGGRPPIDFDLDAIFDAAEATRTAIEVNGALPRLDASVDVLRAARGRSVTFVLTSDAHHTSELALVDYAARNTERAGLDPARIANTWPAAELRAWARS